MIRGFILGKFMPPHRGHLFACEVARRRVDQLTVLVCSRDAEPIPGDMRAAWMRESLPYPDCRIIHMHRDIPQEPKDHPDFWQIWKDAVNEHHPENIDWVFGSEHYVHQLADTLDARPFIIDHQRLTFPISATEIRSNPARFWKYIPFSVRPYFQTHITLIGPESTGKSSLSRFLAEHFRGSEIPEYGREYDAIFRNGAGWEPQDFTNIAMGHLALAEVIAKNSEKIVLEDTDLIQTIVWAEALLGAVPPELLSFLENHSKNKHYLLLEPQMPWQDDGTRYHSSFDTRQWFVERLKYWLSKTGARWTKIDGATWEQRRDQALSATEDVIALKAEE